MAAKKVVQTELGEDEYEILSTVAKREKLTIKEACQESPPRMEHVSPRPERRPSIPSKTREVQAEDQGFGD